MTDLTQHNDTSIEQFDDIRPYDDHQFREKIASLVREPAFEHAVRYVMPDVDYNDFVSKLITIESQMDFRLKSWGHSSRCWLPAQQTG